MGTHRIQLDMTEKMRDLLDALVGESQAATRAEVIRRAISIYALLIREKKAGNRLELVSKKSRTRRELLLAEWVDGSSL